MAHAVRHLHRDYSTSFCGKDISHLLATFDEKECTCKGCKTGLVHFRQRQAADEREERRQQKEAERKVAEETERLRKQQDEARQASAERQRRIEEAVAWMQKP